MYGDTHLNLVLIKGFSFTLICVLFAHKSPFVFLFHNRKKENKKKCFIFVDLKWRVRGREAFQYVCYSFWMSCEFRNSLFLLTMISRPVDQKCKTVISFSF